MPYISPEDREKFTKHEVDYIEAIAELIENCGELNYVITRLCHEYIKNRSEKYQHYNDIMGALEGAKLELYRRKISPYEDSKIESNGDV
jgi:hypothetical protein